MIRRMSAAASVASLLLFLGTVGMWVRGHWRADGIAVGRANSVWASQGSFMWWNYDPPGNFQSAAQFVHRTMTVDDAWYVRSMIEAESRWSLKWDHMGMHLWIGRTIAASGHRGIMNLTMTPSRVVILPAWLIAGLLLIMPLAWGARRWRQHWLRVHRICLHCGYDLRASTDRCPECGTAIGSAGGRVR